MDKNASKNVLKGPSIQSKTEFFLVELSEESLPLRFTKLLQVGNNLHYKHLRLPELKL